MPAEVFITTSKQSVLLYLLQPLAQTFARTFRELKPAGELTRGVRLGNIGELRMDLRRGDRSGRWGSQRARENTRRVHRLAADAVSDLMAAARAIRDDERVGIGRAHRGQ